MCLLYIVNIFIMKRVFFV